MKKWVWNLTGAHIKDRDVSGTDWVAHKQFFLQFYWQYWESKPDDSSSLLFCFVFCVLEWSWLSLGQLASDLWREINSEYEWVGWLWSWHHLLEIEPCSNLERARSHGQRFLLYIEMKMRIWICLIGCRIVWCGPAQIFLYQLVICSRVMQLSLSNSC